jgi:hypothetical protein
MDSDTMQRRLGLVRDSITKATAIGVETDLRLSDHPDFASGSPYCLEHMRKFSQALAAMRHKSFVTRSTAEAKQSDLVIAEDAAMSRLRPIPDGPDQWEVHRSSADSGSCGPVGHLSSDNVLT